MADNDKQKFDIPWATLLPIIAALAGIVVQFRPLVSERPAVPGEKTVPVIAAQDVDARLWQDPIGVAQKQKALLDEQIDKGVAKKGSAESHDIGALCNLLCERTDTFQAPGSVLLLAVMLDAGPYSEQAESRLRARQAVLEGLSESGFVPVDGEHIGYVTATWPPPETNVPSAPIERALLLPWEECEAMDDSENVFPKDTKRVFVVWLPSVNFNVNPLRCFAALINQLAPGEIRDQIDVKLIGPANSTGLQGMVHEAFWDPLKPRWPGPLSDEDFKAMQNALDGVSIISPRATASDLALLSAAGVPASSTNSSVRTVLEESMEPGPRDGLHFVRTIATDDVVLCKLIDELRLRQIAVVDEKREDKVVLLTEWDSLYGRSLAKTFAALASTPGQEQDCIARGQLLNQSYSRIEEPDRWPKWILSYRYLRGIDGRLPGDPAKANARDDSQKAQPTQGPAAIEATEGLDQSDFLRRLARELKDKDTQWWRKGKGGIRAIGLLGSDIYDKLMILRALRPHFRDVVFFTNDYDAHFERRDDWGDVRNLVVASPFGSTLPRIELPDGTWFKQHVAPFRDNLQTSMFFGTLAATTRLDSNTITRELDGQPRMFEIGRRGSVELNQEDTRWFREWFLSHGVWWHLILGAAALLFIIFWIGLSSVDRRLPGGGGKEERLKRTCFSTPFWLIFGMPIIVLSVAYFSQSEKAVQEPLAFFSGISIWPSEMLRLIALVLAIRFMIKAHVDLRANEREVTERFFSGSSPPSEKWHWRNPRLGLRRWSKEHPEWVGSDTPFSAKEAWSAYLVRNQFWPRFIRIGTLFVIYFGFSYAVFTLFPRPVTPTRGAIALRADKVVLLLTVIAMMILTFYIVDAIRLNSNFIRIFTYGVTKWVPDISLGKDWIPPLTEEDLSRYRDIFFVAQRTEAVAPLIWYPLIVLTAMFVARSSFFDNWTWPLSLILIFTLNSMWAIGSAVFLRRAAEQLRDSAISKLQLLRVKNFSIAGRAQIFDELIAEIRGLKKGAFAPLTEQPFVRAILYPSGGIGLLAVAQHLLGIF